MTVYLTILTAPPRRRGLFAAQWIADADDAGDCFGGKVHRRPAGGTHLAVGKAWSSQ